VIRSHIARGITRPTSVAKKDTLITVTLSPKGYDIFSATPVRSFTTPSGPIIVGNIGLLGKFSGAAGIVGIDIFEQKGHALRVYSSFKALGTVGFYISDLAVRSVEDDFMGQLFGKPIGLGCVKKSLEYVDVLEVDTEKAWAESDQKVRYGIHVLKPGVFVSLLM
jgi:hypothetical protein